MTHERRVAIVLQALGEALSKDEFAHAEDALERAKFIAARLEGEAKAIRLAIVAVQNEIARRAKLSETVS